MDKFRKSAWTKAGDYYGIGFVYFINKIDGIQQDVISQ
jgi:hypothetical protein